ncbi:MAG: polyphenol oxidase family protein [Microthrixaceae bacterium]|nr:polyphenol oxidase family protein [Microthrixaceae bacterium]
MRAHWVFTNVNDGDFSGSASSDDLNRRCRDLIDRPWTLLDQVHGTDVVVVTEPGGGTGRSADASVTACVGAVLAVRTADCAAVVLVGRDDAGQATSVGVAHAGWRGLLLGVLQSTVHELEMLGAKTVEWHLGPCISAPRYEFGKTDLDRLVQRYGTSLRSTTSTGAPALDMRAGVRAAMAETIAEPNDHDPACTASSSDYYSWRARSDRGRQVTAVWLDAEDR